MSQRSVTYKRILQCFFIFLTFNLVGKYEEIILIQIIARVGFIAVSLYLSWQLSKFVTRSGVKVSPYDKSVLITGCDSGFGNFLATQLVSLGFQVFAGVHKPDGEGAKRLRKIHNNLHVIGLDVRDEEAVKKAKEFVISNLQPQRKLWAVVNNAGIGHYAGVDWGPENVDEIYKDQFEVNAFGPIRITRHFLPLLRKTTGSRVVMVASVTARFVFPGLTGYSMTKHAVRALGNGLRRETRPHGVSVSIIEPAMYATPITDVEACKKDLRTNWLNTPEERRKEIGESEYKELEKKVESFLLMRRTSIQEVIDSMLDSIMAEDPRYYYQVGGIREWLSLHVLEFLPEEIQDFFLDGAMFHSILKLIQNQA